VATAPEGDLAARNDYGDAHCPAAQRRPLGCYLGGDDAEASYPATEPMVIACGGTTVGNVTGSTFDEFAWNDVGAAGPGASGGGISAKFPVPSYQNGAGVPKHISSHKAGAVFLTSRATPARTAATCKLPPDLKLNLWAGQVPSRRCMPVCSPGLIPTSGFR
jgi:hypothetical protein